MAGVGEHYYELHAGRRGHAAAGEAMLRAVTFIRKLDQRTSTAPGSSWSA